MERIERFDSFSTDPLEDVLKDPILVESLATNFSDSDDRFSASSPPKPDVLIQDLSIRFDLRDLLKDFEDWETAYQITETICLKFNYSQQFSTFISVSSKILLTTSILLCYQTPFPDLLSVRNLLLLPKLKQRLCYAYSQDKLINFGLEVVNGFQHFTGCPHCGETIQTIVSQAVNALDRHLRTMVDLTVTEEDFNSRLDYLKQLLPLPLCGDSIGCKNYFGDS